VRALSWFLKFIGAHLILCICLNGALRSLSVDKFEIWNSAFYFKINMSFIAIINPAIFWISFFGDLIKYLIWSEFFEFSLRLVLNKKKGLVEKNGYIFIGWQETVIKLLNWYFRQSLNCIQIEDFRENSGKNNFS
jgi:hypothetical protein